jgi:hypothetical protein
MSDFDILIEELDKISNKWAQRLSYQSNQGKDIHDSFLCSTVMYEVERAKQAANKRIAEERQKKFEELRKKD